jgi:putative SOS response-associated peptidase YedK
MCSRFSLHSKQQIIERVFNIQFKQNEFQSHFNIAPFQKILCIKGNNPSTLEYLTWGIKQIWAGQSTSIINARSETVSSAPLFSSSFHRSRCLIIADGFYEWQHLGKSKNPSYVKLKSGLPFAFAGISGSWDPKKDNQDTCVILTVPSTASLHSIHNRMPAILHPDDYQKWLNHDHHSSNTALSLLKSFPDDALVIHRVSTTVNFVKNDSPECIQEQPCHEPFQYALL